MRERPTRIEIIKHGDRASATTAARRSRSCCRERLPLSNARRRRAHQGERGPGGLGRLRRQASGLNESIRDCWQ
jgi:hypothetical protein